MRTARQRLDVVLRGRKHRISCKTRKQVPADQIDDSTDLEEPEPLQLH
jgi:hypothetical protein